MRVRVQLNTVLTAGIFLLRTEAYNFIKKETLAQVFSCGFCEIFKNFFLIEHLQRLLCPFLFFLIGIHSVQSFNSHYEALSYKKKKHKKTKAYMKSI